MSWLNEHELARSARLFMKRCDDEREDALVKKEIYLEHIKNSYEVVFVVDDRSSVVKMWRSLGIICLQCASGEY